MKCARCRSELNEGVTFCIGCGFDNGEFSRASQKLNIDEKLQKRSQQRNFWRWLTRIFFFRHRF